MGTTTSFRELIVWQKAHKFVLAIYDSTQKFPSHELYSLVSQFRRAAISIPANIAEGYKRKSKMDKLRFFNIAQASLEECYYFVILSKDLSYINEDIFNKLEQKIEEVSKLLTSYISKFGI
ncbi:MAG: four helix bundle protein [Dysgonamonadaceae bacterium]|jgi:four helix bundle protein|nr:four helix bundle protein [Dysgonamonadaceae bacterium]